MGRDDKNMWDMLKQTHSNAYAYAKAGDYDRAIRCLALVIETIEPHLKPVPSMYTDLASFYVASGDFSKAKEIYDRVIKETHSYGLAWLGLGECYTCTEHIDDAIECYKKAIDFSKNSDENGPKYRHIAYSFLAECYMRQKKFDEAINNYLSALSEYPVVNVPASLYYNMGVCYANAMDFEQSARCFEHILKVDPTNSDTLLALGRVYMAKGKFTKAKDCFTNPSVQPLDEATQVLLKNCDVRIGFSGESAEPEGDLRVAADIVHDDGLLN